MMFNNYNLIVQLHNYLVKFYSSLGSGTITDYYVAFYDKTLTQAATKETFISTIKSNFNSDTKAKNGFLLGYNAVTAKYFVWDYSATASTAEAVDCDTNGCFVEITSLAINGYQICGKNTSGVLDCTNKLYYTVYPGDSLNKLTPDPGLARSWTILLDKNFQSKTLHTAVSVVDNNNLSAFNANIDPTY